MAGIFLPPPAPPAGSLTSRGAVGGTAASLRSVADIYCIGAARRYTTLINLVFFPVSSPSIIVSVLVLPPFFVKVF